MLVDYIKSGFRLKDNLASQIPGIAYSNDDAFFLAHGTYHLLNTCNSWVGRGLRQAGVKVGQFTPLPKTVFFHLPEPDR
jgi:hypothetical protein